MQGISRMSGIAAACCFTMRVWAQDAPPDQHVTNAQTAWAAISKCAAITDEDSRHECSDDVLRHAGLLPAAEDKASKQRKRFGLESLPARAAAAPPTAEAAKAQAAADQVEVTLAAIEEVENGKLLLTTTDGAVWRQAESQVIRPVPKQGETMTITRTSMGGFKCQAGKWSNFRCFRSR